jgi:hypothetical protein
MSSARSVTAKFLPWCGYEYLVEHCPRAASTTFAQIATIASTKYNDMRLVASISYSYRVRATNAAGNLSAHWNVASATTLPCQG